MKIVARFQVARRGLVVVLDETTGLPDCQKLTARIVRPDGTEVSASAHKEWLLRLDESPPQREAFALAELEVSDVPEGSEIQLSL